MPPSAHAATTVVSDGRGRHHGVARVDRERDRSSDGVVAHAETGTDVRTVHMVAQIMRREREREREREQASEREMREETETEREREREWLREKAEYKIQTDSSPDGENSTLNKHLRITAVITIMLYYHIDLSAMYSLLTHHMTRADIRRGGTRKLLLKLKKFTTKICCSFIFQSTFEWY